LNGVNTCIFLQVFFILNKANTVMKISFSWLKDLIHINETPDQIANMLTRSGLEVEGVEKFELVEGGLEGVVIGQVMTCEKHPDADKLSKTTVETGPGTVVPIVCGAPNVAAGQKVIVATVGATLYPVEGEPFKIKKAKIRGEISEGMICAEDEIGLGHSHAGIMVLDTNLPNGTPAAQYFHLEPDHVLEIGLTPNRADAASHIGVARDLKVLTGQKITPPSVEHFKADNQSLPVKIVVENTKACPRYSGLTISGVTVKDSPDWLKKRLKAIGLSPINNVVDATNYVLHELGQPLHAFDADKIEGQTVIVKTLPQDTLFVTLDEKERKLSANDLMICDQKGGMCIAGVFGGLHSGVTSQTQNIFLESAYFSAEYIRRTSQYHGLKTDASFRFERGTDPNMTVFALKRAALLIKEIAGGQISSEITDIYPDKIEAFKVNVKYKNIDRLIGKSLPKDLIHSILNGLEIEIIAPTEDGFTALVPPYRVDVQREADIIEEILRIYGYDNIEVSDRLQADYLAEFPDIDHGKIQSNITQLLAANGFSEIITNSLTKPHYASLAEGLKEEENVVILNQLSEDLGVLRQNLLFTGLEVLAYNINRKQKDLKLFEFGKAYYKRNGKYKEENRLGVFITGNKESETWIQKSQKADFHDLADIIYKLLGKFNIEKFDSRVIHNKTFSYGLEIMVNDQVIITAGKVSKKINSALDIKQDVFFADIQWELLLKKKKNTITYKEVSKFPEVRRDLSLVIDKKVTFDQIRTLAEKTERGLLQKINVFDVYEGENIGSDKKAYALSFILQDKNKTLTDQIIDKTMDKLMKSFESELNALIRK
jgi:phenylalanyl-tRNA synthetase beta chain